MKKLVIWFHFKENYTVSDSVLLQFQSLLKNRELLLLRGYELIDCREFISDQKERDMILDPEKNYKMENNSHKSILQKAFKQFIEQVKNTPNFDEAILIGFHPIGSDPIFNHNNYEILKAKKCKCIMWQDDVHAYQRAYLRNHNLHEADFTGYFEDHRLDKADLILSPGSIYVENTSSNYKGKTCFIPFIFDESNLPFLNTPFRERESKILLSGAIGKQSTARLNFLRLYQNKKSGMHNIIDHLAKQPGLIGGNTSMRGLNYYKKISEYKAAFVGSYDFPINYIVAKVVEVLACGTLLIADSNPLLQKQYGLQEYVHYIPLLVDSENNIIDDASYYLKYIDSEVGAKIAENGRQHVLSHFSTKTYTEILLNLLETSS